MHNTLPSFSTGGKASACLFLAVFKLRRTKRNWYWNPEGYQAYKLAMFNNGHSI